MQKRHSMNAAKILGRVLIIVTLSLPLLSAAVSADNGQGKQGDALDIGVSGNVKVDITAGGRGQLQVEARGPARVWICTGKECLLQVEALPPSEINVNESCDPAVIQTKLNNELEIIPGVLRVQGLALLNKTDDKQAGRLVVFLLGSRYEL